MAYRYVGGANRVDEKFIKVFKTIKSFGPDAVISYMGGANMLACLIRLAGRRFHLIVSERSLTQRLDLKTRLKFFLYRFSDYVVPNSHAESDFIARNIPALRKKLVTITNFVDLDRFYPDYTLFREEKILRLLCVASVRRVKIRWD